MGRIALLSDIHADAGSLRDALRACEQADCALVLCAGDLVDYGPEPEATVDLLRRAQVPCVRGNHDRWAVDRAGRPSLFGTSFGTLAPEPAPLSDQTLAYLDALPTTLSVEHGGLRLLVCHARPRSDMEGVFPREPATATLVDWLLDARADVLCVGHTHEPLVRRLPAGRLVVNPGTLLRTASDALAPTFVLDRATGQYVEQPRLMGTFAILDVDSRQVELRRASDGALVTVGAGP